MVKMQFLEFALVRKAFLGYVDEMILREVEVLKLRVELHRTVYSLNLVVADYESLDGRVERDGQHVEAALFAHYY